MSEKFKVQIDKQTTDAPKAEMNGAELLALVGKKPGSHHIHRMLRGGQVEPIGADEIVNLADPGIERFVTLPLDQTEGDGQARRDFQLPQQDERFVEARKLHWETVQDGNKRWLLLYEYPLPQGYTASSSTVAIHIAPGYPDAALDMAWFNPAVSLKSGKQIRATSGSATILGKAFQQWSRHRTGNNPWRPGIDCIATHCGLIDHWLERELQK